MTSCRGHRVSQIIAAAPLEEENILTEILVRLPAEPSSLPRASVVCEPRGRLAAFADFRRRWRDHHGRPPVIGVFEHYRRKLLFIPALHPPDRIPAERFSIKICANDAWDTWRVLGCWQGRVLIMNWTRREFLIYDPLSGDRRWVSFPPAFVDNGVYQATGDVLWDEQSPFKVVLVASMGRGVQARVYSSKIGAWGDIISTAEPCDLTCVPVTVIGNRLYYWVTEPRDSILELNLNNQSLSLFKRPPQVKIHYGTSRIIPGEDGAVGLAILLYPTIEIWNCNIDSHGIVTWVLRKTVNMDGILDLPYSRGAWKSIVIGYAEDANAILIKLFKDIWYTPCFTVQLDSMECKRFDGDLRNNLLHLFAGFYTAGPSALQILACVNNDGGAGEA